MKNSTRFVIVISLLVFSWWLQNLLESKPELITQEKTRFANYYLEDFTLTAHNKDGKPKYILKAKRLNHFEQESLAEIEQVHAEIFNKESNWTVTAANAKLYQDKDTIDFFGNVKIYRPKQKNTTEFSFHADKMTLLTEQEIIKTDSYVKVKKSDTIIESKGLTYDGRQGILELKTDVKVTYVK